jgi:hypothetical protein
LDYSSDERGPNDHVPLKNPKIKLNLPMEYIETAIKAQE